MAIFRETKITILTFKWQIYGGSFRDRALGMTNAETEGIIEQNITVEDTVIFTDDSVKKDDKVNMANIVRVDRIILDDKIWSCSTCSYDIKHSV